jgi:hypothetical protein
MTHVDRTTKYHGQNVRDASGSNLAKEMPKTYNREHWPSVYRKTNSISPSMLIFALIGVKSQLLDYDVQLLRSELFNKQNVNPYLSA